MLDTVSGLPATATRPAGETPAGMGLGLFQGDKLVSVPGQLTLLGKTHPVTLKAVHFNCYKSPMFNGREVCGGDFETTIDRTQWGMDYLVKMGMPTSVHLITQIEAVQK